MDKNELYFMKKKIKKAIPILALSGCALYGVLYSAMNGALTNRAFSTNNTCTAHINWLSPRFHKKAYIAKFENNHLVSHKIRDSYDSLYVSIIDSNADDSGDYFVIKDSNNILKGTRQEYKENLTRDLDNILVKSRKENEAEARELCQNRINEFLAKH